MSFTDANSNWIYAYKSGSSISSDSMTANLAEHSSFGNMNPNLQTAVGGDGTYLFTITAATSTTASSQGSSSGGVSISIPSKLNSIRLAHGILASIEFVVLMPFGAIAIHILSFKGLIWLHAGWMIFAYTMVLAALGMGMWMAVTLDLIDSPHAIIGLVASSALLLQPITGWFTTFSTSDLVVEMSQLTLTFGRVVL